ncbi:prolipoprotein diacylglyceryl transferase [Candidatus Pelagibacter sp.]|nr:prolipoprotein diacylglyceryl transferase [Candidatus Pelagibacter sp.]
MFTNNFDPVAFEIFSISIKWYSLAYIFGIIFGWVYCKKILIKDDTILKLFEDYVSYLIMGIIIGGRLGYVIFYNFPYFLNNPIEIFMIWNGGMSFHGGLIGVIISSYLFSKKNKKDIFIFLDLVSITAPIGIFFGRISNFVNGELVGKITNSSWGVFFPNYDDKLRHPSQLYEAFLEGIILFILMNLIFFNKSYKIGTCSIMFLILYGFFRITSEFFREPDIQIGYLYGHVSMGILLSAIMILIGFLIYLKKKDENKSQKI